MLGLHPVDACVVLVYLFGVTAVGMLMGKQVKGLSDYFMPRRFGKSMMMMHAFGTGTASDQAVIVASGTFRNGLSGIWYQWLWLFNTPFYWLIAPIFRRFRAVTTADVYRLRFGPSVAVLFAVVGIAGLAVKIGLMLKGSAALIDAGTGGAVATNVAIPLIAILFVLYGAAGGLRAAIVTDYVQGILTVIFSFMLLPFVLGAVGGIAGIRDTIADPQLMSLVAPDEIGVFFISMFAVLSLTGIVAQPFIMGVCAAGRTEMDGRFGFVVGNLIKRICTVAWALTGIGALAWFIQQGTVPDDVDPDLVYGQMAARFLPDFLPGLLGLFVAALLAGVMSSCDSFMVSASGLLTENVYKPLVPAKSDRHYIWVGRIGSVAIVAGGVVAAFAMPNVVDGLKTWLKIAPMLGVSFWLGLFWRRYNAAGAWASTLTGFASWWMTTQPWFIEWVEGWPATASLGLVWVEAGKPAIYEPWQILFYLSLAVMAGVAVSRMTNPADQKMVEQFHALIRTPVQTGEIVETPCQLPRDVQPIQRHSWFKDTDFEFPAPSITSVIGFLLSWIAVAAMIGGFVWLVS